jgi:hypothetical protein
MLDTITAHGRGVAAELARRLLLRVWRVQGALASRAAEGRPAGHRGSAQLTLQEHSGTVYVVAVDGDRVVSVAADAMLCVWPPISLSLGVRFRG